MTHGNAPLRLGAVTYLNTEPLVYRLAETYPDVRVEFDVPRRLAERLADGRLDVALIPTASFFRGTEYRIVSDACIACRGPVWSVKLMSRVPFEAIRTMAVDEGSATSVVLSQILLDRCCHTQPDLKPLPLQAVPEACGADAVMMIGDRAMAPAHAEFTHVWDLGDQWCRWAQRPFVFAVWAARQGADTRFLETLLTEVRDAGLEHLWHVAHAAADRRGMQAGDCYRYLHDNLHFRLGPTETEGMRLFYREALRMGLVPEGQERRIDAFATVR